MCCCRQSHPDGGDSVPHARHSFDTKTVQSTLSWWGGGCTQWFSTLIASGAQPYFIKWRKMVLSIQVYMSSTSCQCVICILWNVDIKIVYKRCDTSGLVWSWTVAKSKKYHMEKWFVNVHTRVFNNVTVIILLVFTESSSWKSQVTTEYKQLVFVAVIVKQHRSFYSVLALS